LKLWLHFKTFILFMKLSKTPRGIQRTVTVAIIECETCYVRYITDFFKSTVSDLIWQQRRFLTWSVQYVTNHHTRVERLLKVVFRSRTGMKRGFQNRQTGKTFLKMNCKIFNTNRSAAPFQVFVNS